MPRPVPSLSDPGPTDVLIALVPDRGDRAADHRCLAALATLARSPVPTTPPHDSPPAPTLTIAQHCAVCGSDAHGRPMLVTADGRAIPGVHLSLSRAGGWVALAATLAGPMGIDIESLDAVRAAAFDDVAFDARERAALRMIDEAHGPAAIDRMRALAWSAKEAVLKAAGTGLATDPREVHLDLHSAEGQPIVRPAGPFDERPVTLHPLAAAGLLGHVAVTTHATLRIRWQQLSPDCA
ncbi:4'-phosphopantetheinyl transferase superfamily protein [Herbiconiux sp. CPCC 205763]|uniref:4'-phosphopantetheinyl transferase superfamily protein n=1 Tax=Herbiconiux aconitum TaxID=2970913 RepID=A0ABT2GQ71_9MICO|nr:4'-phosphopantetheinyl transferase superfamily protein [Herbiconiux aconitum]MCS5718375.1 4'-phosphopantetheinyl transferase superfamily protein [Herbiconiux aconitum]